MKHTTYYVFYKKVIDENRGGEERKENTKKL